MDKQGRWTLSPDFDMTYNFNPRGDWTSVHQMSINGRRSDFSVADFRVCAKTAGMKRGRAEAILEEVERAVGRWTEFAEAARVAPERSEAIGSNLRRGFLG